ncbi:MAG TPA: TIGR03619 family F420-dependent LLM class oxidoreductase [Acidimicrobiales bacterium]
MRYWLCVMFEDNSQLLDIARAAEEIGFHGIAVADHVAVPHGFRSVHPSGENPFVPTTNFPDPFTTIAAMAAVTTRLHFLPYVYVLPLRDPFTVAKQAGTVSMLSNGRFVLGVGAGWLREEFELLGQDSRTRGQRMDEMIAILRGFWDHGTTEFHGRHFDFGPTSMYPKPDHHVPICVGGKSDAAIRRAARNDGWLGMNYDLDEIQVLLAKLREERKRVLDERGDDGRPFETLVIPNAMPTPELHAELEAQGVTSTIAVVWPQGDAAFATLDAKRAAMEAFADKFMRPAT